MAELTLTELKIFLAEGGGNCKKQINKNERYYM